ncbi:hypothetical protein AM500_10230 [Bacillus sp. FJAT-18017]|uniref:hypothetical protein n=1 Tax=Bacillus sp. FJAT-18017 TaxID=1705566 RepID=UPI0006AF5817|nr:hypothetical protein [Bacillus sp. FJAT-18017]ALC90122.1 hypothetical protein AM500_10230 [Bacillus sp. FJAT-18017]
MTYIIENAVILRGDKLSRESIMTDGTVIEAIRPDLSRYTFTKMNVDGFIMTPAFSILDGSILANDNAVQSLHGYLMSGVTTVITYIQIQYERELHIKLEEAHRQLEESPADYAIAVKIPLSGLTPAIVRECKRRKVPAIFVEVPSGAFLDKAAWGWIREAMFPGNCPLIPIFNESENGSEKQLLSKWKKTMTSEKLPSVLHELRENIPLSPYELNKLGIYPQRSSLLHKSELSYNLYIDDFEAENVDEASMFLYHRNRLAITVRRGQIIRHGDHAGFSIMNGEHIRIKTHSYYSF